MAQRASAKKATPAAAPVAAQGAPAKPANPASRSVSDPESRAKSLRARLAELRSAAASDPFINPVQCLGREIAEQLDSGALPPDALADLVQHLIGKGFEVRADRLRRYFGKTEPGANEQSLRGLFQHLARDGARAKGTVPFPVFKARVEQALFGIVFTAHPTFSTNARVFEALAILATNHDPQGRALSERKREQLIRQISGENHMPDQPLNLATEQKLSIAAIVNLRRALRRAHGLLLEVAAEHYPKEWTALKPRLLTIASWVGYDLDGRNDIRWTDVLQRRLIIQEVQLARMLDDIHSLRQSGTRSGAKSAQKKSKGALRDDLDQLLELAESKLALAIKEVRDEIEVFGDFDPGHQSDTEHLQRISQRMHEGRDRRLTDGSEIVDLLDRAMELAMPDAMRREMCLIRAEIANAGLGLAHMHVRINAQQIHNSIRKAVDLRSSPEDARFRKSLIAKMNTLLDEVKPVSINFGSVMNERPSAKRLFMICRQILTYVDSATPIRFLIAETESSFTVLAALYYARLFGVEDRLEICPLFETEAAIQQGSKIIDTLLENPHFRRYVEKTGKLCIQTGYSDAGRYLGQTPAGGSIERLKGRVARLFEKHGLKNVQFISFDTHGESIGRGGHPGGFLERFRYITHPRSLNAFRSWGIPYKQESTFQGGDGYLYFLTETGALAALTRVMEYALAPTEGTPAAGENDPYYDERDYVTEFFTTVKEFQVALMNEPSYGALLSAFAPNLLYPTGSRALKRQHDSASGDIDYRHPTQIRAIPHNGMLQQLGLLANSIGGVGEAIHKDPQDFLSLYKRSGRFRQLIAIARYGAAVSDGDILHAYLDLTDPAFWLQQAAECESQERRDAMLRLTEHFEDLPIHRETAPVFRKLYRDYIELRRGLEMLGAEGKVREGDPAYVSEETRELLAVLHAVRLAILQEIYLVGTRIPQFSSQHNTTHKRIMQRLLQLEIDHVMEAMSRIFPLTDAPAKAEDYGEHATYETDESQDYSQEHVRIFQPIRRLHELSRQLTTAAVHVTGAIG